MISAATIKRLLCFAGHILCCHNLPDSVAFEPGVCPSQFYLVPSPADLYVYRTLAAVQDSNGVAKEMNGNLVYLARFFGGLARGLGYGLLLRVTRPIWGSSLKIFRQNGLFDAVMRTARLAHSRS